MKTSIFVIDAQPQYEAFGAEPVCATIYGQCNHADRKFVTTEFNNNADQFYANAPSASWYHNLEICRGCDAWRFEDTEEWFYE